MSDFFTTSVLVATFAAGMRLATPYLFAALGELLGQRSGVLNLGVDGVMLIGAFFAYWVALETGNLWWAVAAAAGVIETSSSRQPTNEVENAFICWSPDFATRGPGAASEPPIPGPRGAPQPIRSSSGSAPSPAAVPPVGRRRATSPSVRGGRSR